MANKERKPVFVSKNGPPLSNLFFTDDLILFGEASSAQASVIKGCLNRFCEASRQKVSFNKSVVHFSKNVNPQLKDDISRELGVSTTDDLGRYLGMPAIHGRVTKRTFQQVLDRINKRLAGWKTKVLSLAGRATLVQ